MKRLVCVMLCACMMLCMSGCCVSTLVTERLNAPAQRVEDQEVATFEIRDENGKVWLDGTALESAGASWQPSNEGEWIPSVMVVLNPSGAQTFYQATLQNMGKQLEIYVDGELITAPTVNEAVQDGALVISGGDIESLEDAQVIADVINRAIVYEDDYTLTK